MHLHLSTHALNCPYCGERFEVVVDPSEPDQQYVEDCWVCCRPIVMSVSIDEDGGVSVFGHSENE